MKEKSSVVVVIFGENCIDFKPYKNVHSSVSFLKHVFDKINKANNRDADDGLVAFCNHDKKWVDLRISFNGILLKDFRVSCNSNSIDSMVRSIDEVFRLAITDFMEDGIYLQMEKE